MNARDAQTLIEKLKSLTPQRQAEVEDLVDFLKSRETDRQLTRGAARASEPTLAKVWSNEDDPEYDRL